MSPNLDQLDIHFNPASDLLMKGSILEDFTSNPALPHQLSESDWLQTSNMFSRISTPSCKALATFFLVANEYATAASYSYKIPPNYDMNPAGTAYDSNNVSLKRLDSVSC
jgi:hypothetical protein